MFHTGDPRNGTFSTETESAVRYATVTTKVEVPLVIFNVQFVLLDSSFENLEFVFALTATDDFSVTEWSNQVGTESVLAVVIDSSAVRIVCIFEIERFDL